LSAEDVISVNIKEVEEKFFYATIKWKKEKREIETLINKRLMSSSVFLNLVQEYKYLSNYMNSDFEVMGKDENEEKAVR